MTPALFAALRTALGLRLLTAVAALFRRFETWGAADETAFAAQVTPLVQGGQRALAGLTAVSVASQASAALGRRITPPGVSGSASVGLRTGVDPTEPWHRPFAVVRYAISRDQPVARAVQLGEARARQIAEMDLQQTYAESSRAAMRALPESDRPIGWRRILTGARSCDRCTVAAVKLWNIDTLSPLHGNCVPGTALVRARSVQAMTRRRYAGELAVVTIADGDQVSVTPEHPVLADRGWITAGEVRPGDHLVRSGGRQRTVGGRPDESDVPARAEDVWRAFTMTFCPVRVPLAAEDFHGDGAHGEVDVVRTDGHLAAVRNAAGVQRIGEPLLVNGSRLGGQLPAVRAAVTFVGGRGATADRDMGGVSLRLPLFRCHSCGTDMSSRGSVAPPDAGVSEPALHNVPADPLTVRDDVLSRSLVEVVGAQALHRVTDVFRVPFTGHVFNFQTRSATYESDSHIIHNCDCLIEPVYGDDTAADESLLARALVAADKLAKHPGAHRSVDDVVALLDAMTPDHGELGPMLVRPTDHFTTAAQLPL